MFDIIIEAKNNHQHSNEELVILSNDVIEREIGENIKQSKVAVIFVANHRENLYSIFTWLTNFQLEQYSRFILNLPKDYKDYKDYFLQEEQQSEYSKIKAFNDVQDKKWLARKYFNLSNHEPSNHYLLFQVNIIKLQKYLEYPYEYNTAIYKPEFLGSVDSYYNYSCDNILINNYLLRILICRNQKIYKNPIKLLKLYVKTFFLDLMGLPSYSIRYMDDGTTIYSESESLYSNDKVKVIGHDTGYFHKYFAGLGFE
ncbi:hypothetical protein KNCP2_10820 [Candidatus Rickettsia kedanie]|uniref:Uncharacterized protein n=1 Tax=Candidatus Rickettsia kedanie TaxID=3115352 RepID=A0ABP9TU68_9RICK